MLAAILSSERLMPCYPGALHVVGTLTSSQVTRCDGLSETLQSGSLPALPGDNRPYVNLSRVVSG
jgi:hypothetical protein